MATVVEAGHVPPAVIEALRAKHPQYRDHHLEHRPALRIGIVRVTRWSAAGG